HPATSARSLPDALPTCPQGVQRPDTRAPQQHGRQRRQGQQHQQAGQQHLFLFCSHTFLLLCKDRPCGKGRGGLILCDGGFTAPPDRKSTRLNSSHVSIS